MAMTTAIVHHPLYAEHYTGEGHPERPERYRVVMDELRGDASLWSSLQEIEATPAARGDLGACHTARHIKRVERLVIEGGGHLDADTFVSMRSFDAAVLAAGGACRAVDAVISGEARNAFVAARPPGHHATNEHAMGFCLFNNVAIAARYAQKSHGIERVCIVDWDVHHGNGTQGMFYDDPSVFFFSAHQFPWYPGSGDRGETGTGRGLGLTLNLPVRAHTPAADYRRMFDAVIHDVSSRFQPGLIIISSGFDARLGDPLGQLMLEEDDFAALTMTVKQWADEACEGRIVSCLEGGYNLRNLGASVRAHVSALAAGMEPP